MKADVFKSLIKECLREVLKEEFANMQLTPKQVVPQTQVQSHTVNSGIPQRLSGNPLQEMLAQTKASMNQSEYRTILDVNSSSLQGKNIDLVNGRLPEGEVSLNTIMQLVGKK